MLALDKFSALAAILTVGFLAGCGEEVADAVTPAESQMPAAATLAGELGALPGASEALGHHQRLADEFANLDPSETDWESEAFNEDVTAKMKVLVAKYLVQDAKAGPGKFSDLLAEDFVSTTLRPSALRLLFDSDEMVIGGHDTANELESTLRDGEAFAGLLTDLGKPIEQATDKHAKFKVMHVERTDAIVRTRMLFEMSGKKPEGWFQATAVWHSDWTLTEPPRMKSLRVSDYREAAPNTGRIEFNDIAPQVLASTGSYAEQLAPSFDYWRARSDRNLVADLLGAQGLALGDVNGDQLDDIYVLQPGGLPNRLFLHQADGTAIDFSKEAGVDILDFCRSALFVDLDNDGDQDLAVGLAWTLVVFENDGQGRFAKRATISSGGQINSMAAADYDLDGHVDLYLCGRDASGEIKVEQGALGIPMPYYDANNGGPNALLRNESDFVFSNVTKAVGMDVNNRRFSLACAWEDFDNDGDQDLYVANDFGRNNLFRNNGRDDTGRVTFTDIAESAGVLDIGPGMSAAWGDYNNDGLMDLYVGNMWSNAGNRITLQKEFLPGADAATREQARRHARGNSVYLNTGNGTFQDLTQQSGANRARWAWSSNFIDLNNDGLQDMVVANGMITAGDTGDL